jgi:hypothetical protein
LVAVLQAPLVFDFQPRDPEDALAALAALSRSKIPGNKRRFFSSQQSGKKFQHKV